jgi:aromatic-L-amino-acid decarboxylase
MPRKISFHMSPEDFLQNGQKLLEWIAGYQQKVEDLPVLSKVKPGDIRQQLPKKPPHKGESFDKILKDSEEIILPGITHWQSPNFFAYFPANTSGPAILGDLLSSGLGVQGMIWATSPACTELETHVLDWLADILDLPAKFKSDKTGGGVIQDSASSATLCALLAAREKANGFLSNEKGCDGNLVAYASKQAHSSIEKAVKIAGLGRENLRLIDVDEKFALIPDHLESQIKADKRKGKVPCFVCATVGTTSSNAFDPLEAIGKICRDHRLWLHVDAAMSGTAALCPEYRYIHQGLEYAESYCFNPHKWMFTNFDCDCFYVADRKMLIDTLSILPEYLRNKVSESGMVIDYRDWHIPLGRRFRALKLWFVIRHYGVEGLQHHIRYHVQMAQELVQKINDDRRFELAAPAPLNLVCFRHKAGDEFNEKLLDRLNTSGKIYLVHTRLNEKYTIRFCIGQTHTEMRHVNAAWKLIQDTARKLETEIS